MEVLQVTSELDQMLRLFEERHPTRILEIGCWDGGTLRQWLTLSAPGSTVAAVDLEHRNKAAYDDWSDGRDLYLHTGPSQHPDAVDFMRQHGPYEWVFVDGDHTDQGVRADVANVMPLVAPGGLMLLHDITAGVDAVELEPSAVLLEELAAAGHDTWTYQDMAPAPWTRGIGVVQL